MEGVNEANICVVVDIFFPIYACWNSIISIEEAWEALRGKKKSRLWPLASQWRICYHKIWGTPSCSRPQPATDNGVRDGRSNWLVVATPTLPMGSTTRAPRPYTNRCSRSSTRIDLATPACEATTFPMGSFRVYNVCGWKEIRTGSSCGLISSVEC